MLQLTKVIWPGVGQGQLQSWQANEAAVWSKLGEQARFGGSKALISVLFQEDLKEESSPLGAFQQLHPTEQVFDLCKGPCSAVSSTMAKNTQPKSFQHKGKTSCYVQAILDTRKLA